MKQQHVITQTCTPPRPCCPRRLQVRFLTSTEESTVSSCTTHHVFLWPEMRSPWGYPFCLKIGHFAARMVTEIT